MWCGAPGCIHSYIAKGLQKQKRLSGSRLSPPLIVAQKILVWYPAWQVPLGLHCILLNISMLDKGQEVIISFLYVCTYPTSASTSTNWLGEKCGCTYPPERGHLSVNIHCPPSNRCRLLLISFEKEAGESDQKFSLDLSYLCESTRQRRKDMSCPIYIWTQECAHTQGEKSK